MVTTKIKYKGKHSIWFRTPGYKGKVNPGDSAPVSVDVYNTELKDDSRWELEIPVKENKKKKGDD